MFDWTFVLFWHFTNWPVFILIDFFRDVPPDLRANIDYVVVLRDNIRANRERIYTYFAGVFPTFAAFDQTMQACTENHECLVLDQTSLSYKISDCVYFYKATPDLKYRLGAKEYWRFSSAREERALEPGANESEDDFSEEERRKKSGPPVRVKKRYPSGR